MALFFDTLQLPTGWADRVRIDVRDGLIATVTADATPEPSDERHAIGVPGMPNLHSHAFQRGMAGLAEVRGPGPDSFWTWRETMYRFVDRLTPDDLAAIAALAYAEMLESGFTRVGEFHYLHHDRGGAAFADPVAMSAAIVAAAAETGIALTHLPVFYAHGGFGGVAPGEGQRRFVHDLDGFARLVEALGPALATLPDAVLGVAPHSLRAVTPAELEALPTLVPAGPVHLHVAEQVREVEDCLAWSGRTPVAWLLDHAEVDRRWCLVHATHMTPAETRAVAASGAVAGLCPITEANLGDGLFPLTAYRDGGGAWGIGSDSNVRIDASEELRLLEYGQRLALLRRNVAAAAGGSTGATLFGEAVAGGARALGAAAGIVAGASADLVALDGDHPSLACRGGDALLDGLVFSAGIGAIRHVWRRGSRVVVDGRHVGRDGIVARYRATLARLIG